MAFTVPACVRQIKRAFQIWLLTVTDTPMHFNTTILFYYSVNQTV